jgi:lipoprotein-anchoring transpeptidase ErfK/SrfK
VAVTLPLAGALYLAAEARQAVLRVRYCESVLNTQPSGRTETTTQGSPRPVNAENIEVKSSNLHVTRSARTNAPALAPHAKQPAQMDSEVAAEQQAAQMPAQAPPKQAAKDAHTRQIVISIPDRQLALLQDGQTLKVYPVAVGKEETPSPAGEFTIINHAVNPTYRHDGKEIGPGKSNPLGTRWMGLSLKGYGIHGTNAQSSVGKVASHGCFRMKKKDVEELYKLVQVGDVVSIRSERDGLTASLFAGDGDPGKKATEVASAGTVSTTSGVDQ